MLRILILASLVPTLAFAAEEEDIVDEGASVRVTCECFIGARSVGRALATVSSSNQAAANLAATPACKVKYGSSASAGSCDTN